MNELALFTGAGGGILGGVLLGWRTVCAVENDPYARDVLVARQNDGCLAPFPIWDDVRTFDGRPWAGKVDVISGGFPCQDISAAGGGAGIDGERSSLWSEFARIIREVRPRYAFVENSPVLTSRGLGRVLGDLAGSGRNARWDVLGAVDAGAPHRRKRIWILSSDADRDGLDASLPRESRVQRETFRSTGAPCDIGGVVAREPSGGEDLADPDEERRDGRTGVLGQGRGIEPADGGDSADAKRERLERVEQGGAAAGATDRPGDGSDCSWWATEPAICGVVDGLADELDLHGTAATGYLGRVAHGVSCRVDRLRCLGNGQVPAVARLAWETLR